MLVACKLGWAAAHVLGDAAASGAGAACACVAACREAAAAGPHLQCLRQRLVPLALRLLILPALGRQAVVQLRGVRHDVLLD
jgi:hypothetical protein